MEKSDSANANEIFLENSKKLQKMSQDTTALIMETYVKQISMVSEFYTNFFYSAFGIQKNSFAPQKNMADLFFNNATFKTMYSPLNNFGLGNHFSNPFLNQAPNNFGKLVKEVTDHNHNLMNSIISETEKANENISKAKKDQNKNEKAFEAQKL